MTPQDVPGGISLDQLLPWMRSLELRPFTPSAPPAPHRRLHRELSGDGLRRAA